MKKAKKQKAPEVKVQPETFFVSIDAGNGGTNAVVAREGGYESVYFPSVRASTTGESLGLGAGFEMEYDWVQWGGNKYLIGDDVFISRRAIERHSGSNRYGNELYLCLLTTALARLNIPSGSNIDLTLFAPPSLYKNAKLMIEERLAKKSNKLAIRLKGDEEPRIFNIEQLTVHPEGLGALLLWALDAEGKPVGGDVLSGENVVLDGGSWTLDVLQISNGNFNPESLETATWDGQGIQAHILTPILNSVRKQGADFELLGLDDIDRVLRKGITTGDYTLVSGGSKLELKASFDKYSERYAEWIANNIIDGVFNGLRGIKSLIFVGGGAVLAGPYLQRMYPGKLVSMATEAHTKDVSPIDANAVGGIRLAMSREKA